MIERSSGQGLAGGRLEGSRKRGVSDVRMQRPDAGGEWRDRQKGNKNAFHWVTGEGDAA